jgi:hypothetical protein
MKVGRTENQIARMSMNEIQRRKSSKQVHPPRWAISGNLRLTIQNFLMGQPLQTVHYQDRLHRSSYVRSTMAKQGGSAAHGDPRTPGTDGAGASSQPRSGMLCDAQSQARLFARHDHRRGWALALARTTSDGRGDQRMRNSIDEADRQGCQKAWCC